MLVPVDTLVAFFAASVALSLAPGPDNIFVLTQSALYGRAAGIFVTLGLCIGLIVYTLMVAFGVAAIFQTSVFAFRVLSLLGAAYLSFLAWQAFRSEPLTPSVQGGNSLSPCKLFLRGVVMNLSNPKVGIFFLAFLPAFADPSKGLLQVQLLFLGGIFIVAALSVFSLIACLSGFLGEYLGHSAKAQRLISQVAGIVFIALALRLLLIAF